MALAGCGGDEVVVPSGVEIAFVRRYDDRTEQLRGFSPGQSDVALLPVEAEDARIDDLCWSPDGNLLAFARDVDQLDDVAPELHLLDPKLGETRLLGNGSKPAWSPVGLSLGFLRRDGTGNGALYVLDIDTEDERRIGTGHVVGFSWAPDGRRVVVNGSWPELDSNGALYVVDVKTGEATRIDPDPPNADDLPHDYGPVWSADGSTIAFTSTRAEGDVYSRIYRIDPDGSNFEELPGGDYGARAMSWAPVGESLAYYSWAFDAVEPTDHSVGLLDGGPHFRGGIDIAWSPDAAAIMVVEMTEYEKTRLRMVPLDGGAPWPAPSTELPWSDRSPAWRARR